MVARNSAPRSAKAICFLSSGAKEADEALERLVERYGNCEPAQADVIVALGGDGLMLQTLHRMMNAPKPIYGMNRGSVGFLMNEFHDRGLRKRLENARLSIIHPLVMRTIDAKGATRTARAINEVSLLRQTYQAAKLRISIDGEVRLDELIADGVLLATPAGSTAYNLSANGPILPLDAPLMALTPLSAFRPRRWRGALLPDRAKRFHRSAGSRKAPRRRGRRSQRNQARHAGRHRHGPQDFADAAARPRPFARRAHIARTIRLLKED